MRRLFGGQLQSQRRRCLEPSRTLTTDNPRYSDVNLRTLLRLFLLNPGAASVWPNELQSLSKFSLDTVPQRSLD